MHSQYPQITKQYLRGCSHLVLCRRVLYRWVTPSKEDQDALQLVIPKSYQKKALQGCHDDIRHLGLEWMLDLLWDKFYWPGMTKDVELHIARCEQCITFKSKLQRVAVESIQATCPLQLEHLEYLKIEVTEGGKDVHVLIITDNFLTYTQALVTSSHTARFTAQALWDWFVVCYGLPESIISDQGEILRVTLFQNCTSWQKSGSYVLTHTTHKQMGNVNGLIIH